MVPEHMPSNGPPRCLHVLLDCAKCPPGLLDAPELLLALLTEIAQCCNTSIVKAASHKFHPQGVTAILLLAESHVSVHTWPEHGYAAVDVFSCIPFDGTAVSAIVSRALCTEYVQMQLVERSPQTAA